MVWVNYTVRITTYSQQKQFLIVNSYHGQFIEHLSLIFNLSFVHFFTHNYINNTHLSHIYMVFRVFFLELLWLYCYLHVISFTIFLMKNTIC